MNEDVKMYIPYGAAALGGFVGNWLFNKYPKFGMVGKLVAIAGGVAGGYYISKTILGEEVEMPFKNAVTSTEADRRPTKKCRQACPEGYPRMIDGQCHCFEKKIYSNLVGNPRLTKKGECKNPPICYGKEQKLNVSTCKCESIS